MLDPWIASCAGLKVPLSRQSLEAWQLGRLNHVLAYARAHSSFYRERFPEGPVRSQEAFSSLPFTTSEDLRRMGPLMVCTSADNIERIVTLMETSGSEGAPKRVWFTKADQERTIDFFLHGMMEFAEAGDRVLSLFPGNSPGSLNTLLSEALARIHAETEIYGCPVEQDFDAVIDRILSGRKNRIVGPAAVITALAERSHALGLSCSVSETVDSVLLAGAFVPEESCETIRKLWHCRIDEEYGMTETGLGGGVGCKTAGGYHLWESDLYYEVIDPVTGLPVPDGTEGELVVTTLCREAMPFIRYRTGDISRILPGRCPCGSMLKHLERVQERPMIKGYLRHP